MKKGRRENLAFARLPRTILILDHDKSKTHHVEHDTLHDQKKIDTVGQEIRFFQLSTTL